LEERIRLLCFKHRGNVELVAKEGNVPVEYARKIIDKLRKQQKRDVSMMVSSTIAEQVLIGTEQRKAYLIELLNQEMSKPPEERSICCHNHVKTYIWEGEQQKKCLKCGNACEIELLDNRKKPLILNIINQLRAEDESVVDFLERLGFVNKQLPEAGTKITQYNINMGNHPPRTPPESQTQPAQLDGSDQKLLTDASNLDPRTREALRNELKKKMIESTVVDGPKSAKQD
jgi:hypothetical protein